MSSPFDVFTSSTLELLRKDLPDVKGIQRDMAVNALARELFLAAMKDGIEQDGFNAISPDDIRRVAEWAKAAATIFHDEISK